MRRSMLYVVQEKLRMCYCGRGRELDGRSVAVEGCPMTSMGRMVFAIDVSA